TTSNSIRVNAIVDRRKRAGIGLMVWRPAVWCSARGGRARAAGPPSRFSSGCRCGFAGLAERRPEQPEPPERLRPVGARRAIAPQTGWHWQFGTVFVDVPQETWSKPAPPRRVPVGAFYPPE